MKPTTRSTKGLCLMGLLVCIALCLSGCRTSLARTYSRSEAEALLEQNYLVDFEYVSQKTLQSRPEKIEYLFVVPERDNLQITATASLTGSGVMSPNNPLPFSYYNTLADTYFAALIESKKEAITAKERELNLQFYWPTERPHVQVCVQRYAELADVVQYYEFLCGLLGIEPGAKPQDAYDSDYPSISVYQKDRNGATIGSIELGEANDALLQILEYEYVTDVSKGFIEDDSVPAEVLQQLPPKQIDALYYREQPIADDLIKAFYYNEATGEYECRFDLNQNEDDPVAFCELLGLFAEISYEEPQLLEHDGRNVRKEQTLAYTRGADQYRLTMVYDTNETDSFRSVAGVRVEKNGQQLADYTIQYWKESFLVSTTELGEILGVTISVDYENKRIDLID